MNEVKEVKWDNFPFTSKVYNWEEDCETPWQSICFYVVLCFTFVFAAVIDLARLVIVAVVGFVWKKVIIQLLWENGVIAIWTTILKSFIAKLLGCAALIAVGFFLYWLIKSGTWKSLYDFLSGLLQ